MKPRTPSQNYGANLERSAILKFLRSRLTKLKKHTRAAYAVIQLEDIIMWIGQRNERYNKRKGGLK